MKTKIVLVAVAVLLTGITLGAVAAQYQTYKQQEAQQERLEAQKQAASEASHQAELNGLKARYNQLRAECQKGVEAYGLLPLTTRNKTASPSCGNILSD